jgi:hypothetical protein
MKKFNWIFILFAIVGFALLSCMDETSPPVASNSLNFSENIYKMGDDMHSATGNAHWRFIGTQSRVRFSFSAIQHKDGTFSGQVRNNDEGPTFKFHGEVYNLLVEDNRAIIAFTFSDGSIYSPPGGPIIDLSGWLGCVVVVDNIGNENDVVSLIWGDPPGTIYPTNPPMTVEELFALNIDDYINTVLTLSGLTYNEFMPTIEHGSVHVR